MTFPTVPTLGNGRVVTSSGSDSITPVTVGDLTGLTKNAGDLLIAIYIVYQSTASANLAFSAWGGGFTEFFDSSSSTTIAIGMAYKWSDGTETGTFDVTIAGTISGHFCSFLLSISGAHATEPPVAGSRASGTTAAADPASFDPASWGVEDTLWIAVGANGEDTTTGSFTGITGVPTNYTNAVNIGITLDAVGGMCASIAFRQLNASAEDVGVFAVDTSNARNAAAVIAVRPTPPSALPKSIVRGQAVPRAANF